MKRSSLFLCAVAVLAAQDLRAATKVDSILSLTGGAQAKFAWVRTPWCDANYNPIPAYNDPWYSGIRHNQVLALGTDDGKIRYLDSATGGNDVPRFTRKNGSYVIWSDVVNHCAWIRDFACAQPKRKLIDGTQGDYLVAACGWNPATDSEFVYLLGNFDGTWLGTSIVRLPLKTDYTVDVTKKLVIPYHVDTAALLTWGIVENPATDITIDIHLSASANGAYMVAEIPQPNVGLLKTATGAFLMRHNAADEYGCQQTIAPDNSYRLYHENDNHRILRMWGANLDTTHWDVPLNQNLPGNTGSIAFDPDVASPRWSNHPRFFTASYPQGNDAGVGSAIYTKTAAQVKALAPNQAGNFVVGRFSQDFRSVEAYAMVSGMDIRNVDAGGDAWIPYTPVEVGRKPASAARAANPAGIRAHGGLVEATFGSGNAGVVSIVNSAGRLVARASGSGRLACSVAGEPAGTYLATAASGAGVSVTRVLVTK